MILRSSRGWAMGIILAALGGALASEPKKESPFRSRTDEDGIKTFIVNKPVKETELLPGPPQSLPRCLANSDLAQVPEVGLEDPLSKTGNKREALEDMEFRFAKVNHFNLRKTDGFLQALLAQRPDLAGLPFKMGTECRLPLESGLALGAALRVVHNGSDPMPQTDDEYHQGMVAALMQIHGPREKQAELAQKLGTIPHVEATKALARLALFSPDAAARQLAARGLKVRRDQDYTAILLEGLRYPRPIVAQHAVAALVRLERRDLLPQLVDVLSAVDPRLPVQQKTGWEVRELVRINHHRNCLMCHAPAHTTTVVHLPTPGQESKKVLEELIKEAKDEARKRQDSDFLLAPAPLPNRGFDQASPYGRDSELDRILVRVDITYLRQDFSAMLPVENAAPWPDYQRYDFLVRRRLLNDAEAANVRKSVEPQREGALSPYHQAALFGLRELTGLEATSAADWRRLLNLPPAR